MSKPAESKNAHASGDDVAHFGFWIYLLSDVMIFGSLFATFLVLRHSTAGGPSGADIFEAPYVLWQTVLLLTSSFTAAMALSAARHGLMKQVKVQLLLTAALGFGFLFMEINEFLTLVSEGHTWQTSAFLSSFFTLVGTHGLHITIGLIWLGVLFDAIRRHGLSGRMMGKLTNFVLFWHFLDLVWIGIFTIVYMFGLGVA